MNTSSRLEMILALNVEAFKRGLDVAGTGVRTLSREAGSAFGRLVSAGQSVDGLGRSAGVADGQIRKTAGGVGELGARSKFTAEILGGVASKLLQIAAVGGAALFSVKSAMDFESSMADVEKVVDGADQQIAALRKNIVGMTREIPLTADQLAAISAEGGALGETMNDLPDFTKIVAKMSTAFDMTAQDAGESVGKIKNIYHLNMSEMEVFGDTVNQLGNTMAAKEKDIVPTMMRIGGSAMQFGLANKEAAALSATMLSLGKTPETAATAINSLLAKLQTAESQGPTFQAGLAAMGVSASDLAADIEKGPNAAIVKFLGTLKSMDNADRAKALVNLFGTEFQDDIGTLVTGLDTYKLALDKVADSASYAGGMQREFETRSKTTANQLILTKNAVNEIAINLGSFFLPTINRGLKGVADFTTSLIDFTAKHPEFAAALHRIGDGVKQLFADIKESPVGEAMTAGIRVGISVLQELAAMINSGEMAGYLTAQGVQWQAWADDVGNAVDYVLQQLALLRLDGSGTVSFLTDAFRNFPANVRAFIGLVTVMVVAEFDNIMVRAAAFKDMVKALFNDQTVEGVKAERDRQLKIINDARDETIDSILKERDTAITSTNAQIEAAKKLRAEFEKNRLAKEKANAETAKAADVKPKPEAPKSERASQSDQPATQEKPKSTDQSQAKDFNVKSQAKFIQKDGEWVEIPSQEKTNPAAVSAEKPEAIKTSKEEEKEKKAAEKEQKRLEKEQADKEKAAKKKDEAEARIQAEEERARLKFLKQEEIKLGKDAAEKERLAKEGDAKGQDAEESAEGRDRRTSADNIQITVPDRSAEEHKKRASSAVQAEEEITQANADRVDAVKQGAEEWAQAEGQAAEKAKSAVQRYFDKVKSLQEDVAGRQKSLNQEIEDLDTTTPPESKWQRHAKDARAYEKAAKEAMKAGDLDKALSLADQAKASFSSLKGGAGAVSEKEGDAAALRGVKSSGQLGIDIAKAIQQASAKSALTAMPGGDLFGDLTGRIRGQLAAVAGGGGASAAAGKAEAPVAKVHELKFAGGSMRGGEADVEALLNLLAQAGMSA